MTEREKIIEVIKQASEQAYADFHKIFREGVKRVRDGEISCFTNHDVRPTHDEILADKLIEAGFGYVKDLKAELRSKVNYIDEQDEVIKDCKRRAEVAERALLIACVNLVKDEEDNVNMELLVRVVYTNYLRKAEKELTEEKKDE